MGAMENLIGWGLTTLGGGFYLAVDYVRRFSL
jgi:hypothetical protein